MTRHRRTARTVASLAGLVGLAGLAGCGIHPGDAATVGGYSISRGDVDSATTAQCALTAATADQGQQGQAAPVSSRATVSQNTVISLVLARLSVLYERTHDVSIDESELRTQLVNLDDQLSGQGLSRTQKDALVDYASVAVRGQLIQQAVGAKSVGASAQQSQQLGQQVAQQGAQTVLDWARRTGVDVSVDPRFGVTLRGGKLQVRDGSVSQPVSSAGKQSVSGQPSESYVTGLPLPQRCG